MTFRIPEINEFLYLIQSFAQFCLLRSFETPALGFLKQFPMSFGRNFSEIN
jgi:hypothetical protein